MHDHSSSTSPASERLERFLSYLRESRGTDLLLTAGSQPLVRIDGELQAIAEEATLTPADTEQLIASVLSPQDWERFRAERELDFAFSWAGRSRLRANAFTQRGSVSLALRLVPSQIPTMDELDLPAVVETLLDRPSGLVLVTGPTGSGKSTTLASMVDHVNRRRPCHIITIEDPIEYVHEHGRGAVNQREVGEDTDSFARALRSALREDPDVLMVGEMRDIESIETVLTLAETGHLVFATLHTNDTAQTVDRLISVFPGEKQDQVRVQLAGCLAGVIYQRLLPRIGGGLVAAYEVLVGTTAVRNLIRDGNGRQLRNAITLGQNDGMQTLESHLSRLVADGVVTQEDAALRSLYPKEISSVRPVPNRLAG